MARMSPPQRRRRRLGVKRSPFLGWAAAAAAALQIMTLLMVLPRVGGGDSVIPRGLGDLLSARCVSHDDCRSDSGDGNVLCDVRMGRCRCRRHYYNYRDEQCLPGQLLTFPCLLNAQCQGRVAGSLCLEGRCVCQRGTVAFRRHTCVGGAKVGQVCYGDSQCRLADSKSFCSFVLRGVFGVCRCLHGEDDDEDGGGGCRQEFEGLGSPCFKPGPCPGISNSACVPEAVGRARCECAPGFFTLGKRVCLKKQLRPEQLPRLPLKEEPRQQLKQLQKEAVAAAVVEAASLGYPCDKDAECEASDENSACGPEGVCVCAAFSDGSDGAKTSTRRRRPYRLIGRWPPQPSRTARSPRWFCQRHRLRMCPEGTFQCRSTGSCISRYFLCDGRSHCDDGSDEECQVRNGCPKGSFVCFDGRCVGVSRVCNGVRDCFGGEDEKGCVVAASQLPKRGSFDGLFQRRQGEVCPASSFPCADGSGCVPGYELCNARIACGDRSDEAPELCRPPTSSAEEERRLARDGGPECPFRCDNGNCRAPEVLCSGSDGCGDNSDEKFCHVCKCPPRPP